MGKIGILAPQLGLATSIPAVVVPIGIAAAAGAVCYGTYRLGQWYGRNYG